MLMNTLRYSLLAVFISLGPASVVIGQGLATVDPEEVGLAADRLERIDTVLQRYVDSGQIAGAVALVARGGEVAYLKPFGQANLADGTPMRTDAIFRIASMTKAITSVAVMMLYEEGRLLLSDSVSKYIPAFQDLQVIDSFSEEDTTYTTVPAEREITIHDLLTHTSGIPYGFGGPFQAIYQKAGISGGVTSIDATIGEKMEALAELPLAHQPGAQWTYGLNTDVLGYLVEVVSGQTLAAFFQERIFDPLGMEDTFFYPPPEKVNRMATIYTLSEDGTLEENADTDRLNQFYEGPQTYYSGGGGLSSTASDYARFLQMLLNGGTFEDVRLLSPKTVQIMTISQIDDLAFSPGRSFGLGFSIVTDLGATGTLGSEGSYRWGGAFYTDYWVDPEEDLIGVIMVQIIPNDHLDLHGKFQVLTYQAIVD